MNQPQIPDISGITKMSPLEMNNVRFDKKHTVLTPELLASIISKQQGASAAKAPVDVNQS